MKVLVIFYSLEGHTKLLANAIARVTDADILEVKPVTDIPTKGFMKYFKGGGQVMKKVEPEILPLSVDPNDYDLLYIGTPVWAGGYAPALRTLFSSVKLKDKKIALFTIHRGGPGTALKQMRASLQGNEILGEHELNEKKGMDVNIAAVEGWAQKILS